jgi:hypothetical protein
VADASDTASWLVSTFQLSGTPDSYIYKPNNIITSILPRQEESREAEESESVVSERSERSGVRERRGSEGGRGSEREEELRGHTQESTSEREYGVDA